MKQSLNELFLDNLYYSPIPSKFINALPDEILSEMFPEFAALKTTTQNPDWHPEGNVFVHTMMVIDAAAELKSRLNSDEDKKILMLSALCHDLGKAVTTFEKNGRIVSPMHEQKGIPITQEFINRIAIPESYHKPILDLVREHLRPTQLYLAKDKVSNNAIIRLIRRVNIDLLLLVSAADHFGRLTQDAIDRDFPAEKWLADRCKAVS